MGNGANQAMVPTARMAWRRMFMRPMASYALRNALLRPVIVFQCYCYFSSSVSFLQIPKSFRDLTQAEASVDDRCYLPRCQELADDGQILCVRFRQEDD